MEPVYAITWIWQLQKAARIKTMKFSTSESRKLPLKVRKRQSLFLPDLRDLVAICGTAEESAVSPPIRELVGFAVSAHPCHQFRAIWPV